MFQLWLSPPKLHTHELFSRINRYRASMESVNSLNVNIFFLLFKFFFTSLLFYCFIVAGQVPPAANTLPGEQLITSGSRVSSENSLSAPSQPSASAPSSSLLSNSVESNAERAARDQSEQSAAVLRFFAFDGVCAALGLASFLLLRRRQRTLERQVLERIERDLAALETGV